VIFQLSGELDSAIGYVVDWACLINCFLWGVM